MKQTFQDLKTEIEAIKKAQSEGILDVENWSIQLGTTEVSITNRIQKMEGIISCIEDTIKKINSLVRENITSIKFFAQNLQEIWDTIKTSNQ